MITTAVGHGDAGTLYIVYCTMQVSAMASHSIFG